MMRIAVVTGGDNKERSISLQSGRAVYAALETLGHKPTIIDYPVEKSLLIQQLGNKMYDFVWVMVHGVGGEDGEIQILLDQYGVLSQTASAAVLCVTIDKYRTTRTRKKAGLPVAKGFLVNDDDMHMQDVNNHIIEHIHYPCIAKATCEGSSFDITVLHDERDLYSWRDTKQDNIAYLIEEFVQGQEVTVGVWDTPAGPRALTPILIDHGEEFWSYDSKYNPATREICPAPLGIDTLHKVQLLAVEAYIALGMQSYGRVDMIVTDSGPVLLEINTIPGFTPTSLFPKAASHAGYSFPAMIEYIMNGVLTRENTA